MEWTFLQTRQVKDIILGISNHIKETGYGVGMEGVESYFFTEKLLSIFLIPLSTPSSGKSFHFYDLCVNIKLVLEPVVIERETMSDHLLTKIGSLKSNLCWIVLFKFVIIEVPLTVFIFPTLVKKSIGFIKNCSKLISND
jgi:hypothetical protein